MKNVQFTGILKLSLDDVTIHQVRELVRSLPTEAKALSEENLHVTLVHQNILKPHAKMIRTLNLPTGPVVKLSTHPVMKVIRPDRASWLALVENQEEFRAFVECTLKAFEASLDVKLDREVERVFHVSLANLDGSPFASVGDVRWIDTGLQKY